MTANQLPTQREFLGLAIPNMMAGLAVLVTQLVDLAFLGHLDDISQLSGVVLASVIFDFIFWCFAFLRIGTTGLTAQAIGRKDTAEDAAMLWRAALLGLTIGLTITLLQKPIESISFSILAGENHVEAAGRDYYHTHIWGALPIMINLAIIGWLLGHGRSMTVWILHTVWQVSNIGFNYLFIVKYGWGAWGAGLGTALAEWISLGFGIGAVWYHWGGIPRFDKTRVFHKAEFIQLLTLNSAIMMRTFLLMSVLAAFTNISATFGTVMLAANALVMKLYIFCAFVMDGYAIALETLAGQSSGSQNKAKLKRSFSLAVKWSIGSTLGFILFYLVGLEFALSILTEHQNIIDAAKPYLYWLCSTLLLGGLAFVYDGFFYGLAKPKLLFKSMIFAALAYAPLAYYAWSYHNAHWLWFAFFIFTVVRVATLVNPARKALQ